MILSRRGEESGKHGRQTKGMNDDEDENRKTSVSNSWSQSRKFSQLGRTAQDGRLRVRPHVSLQETWDGKVFDGLVVHHLTAAHSNTTSVCSRMCMKMSSLHTAYTQRELGPTPCPHHLTLSPVLCLHVSTRFLLSCVETGGRGEV